MRTLEKNSRLQGLEQHGCKHSPNPLFSGVCLLSVLFGWKMLPETKGRTLEEIAASWREP